MDFYFRREAGREQAQGTQYKALAVIEAPTGLGQGSRLTSWVTQHLAKVVIIDVLGVSRVQGVTCAHPLPRVPASQPRNPESSPWPWSWL